MTQHSIFACVKSKLTVEIIIHIIIVPLTLHIFCGALCTAVYFFQSIMIKYRMYKHVKGA